MHPYISIKQYCYEKYVGMHLVCYDLYYIGVLAEVTKRGVDSPLRMIVTFINLILLSQGDLQHLIQFALTSGKDHHRLRTKK